MDSMKGKPEVTEFAVCLSNRGYAASLVVRRLYPKRMFATVELPAAVRERIAAASKPAR
jgi:hypothetical protein